MVVGLVVALLAIPPAWRLVGGGRALGPAWWLVSAVGWYVLMWALWAARESFWLGWGCCVAAVLCAWEGLARCRRPPGAM